MKEQQRAQDGRGHVVLNRSCVSCVENLDPDRRCAVCDGALSVCALCGAAEVELFNKACKGALNIHQARAELKRLTASKASRREVLAFVQCLEASSLISSKGCDRIQELLMRT